MDDIVSNKMPLLEIDSVSKFYSVQEVLKNVSISFYRGEIVSLLGVNGAGKTTLSSIIAALHPPTSGDVRCEGISIFTAIGSYRKRVGYCAQKVALQRNFTVYEHLWFAGLSFGLPADSLAYIIEGISEQYAIRDVLHRQPYELSGGYRQRFGIARSLLHSPDIVILDEPTVALDPHVRHQLWEKIAEMKAAGKTVILTTHYLDEAEQLSDRVCFLERGVIRYLDTPQALLSAFGKGRLEEVMLSMME